MKKHIEVVAAIIVFENKILCTQRGINKLEYISQKYEFPGGKVELEETNENALIREIKEELQMDISIGKEFLTVFHEYPDFNMTMHSFICSSKSQDLVLSEHIDYKWLSNEELSKLDWAAADVPIVEKLINDYAE